MNSIEKATRILGAALLGALAALGPAAAADYPRLGDDVAPTAQSVFLTLDPAKTTYSGSAQVDLDVRRSTSTVRFHARGEKLISIELTDAGSKSVPVELSQVGEIATLTTATPLSPGRHRLAIEFEQSFNQRAVGLYRVEFGGEPYLYTQMEATEAREAFPCWDEPAFKIPWRLTLIVPESQAAIANAPIERESVAGGMRRVEFAATPPMPSYLVAMAVGPFEFVPVAGTSIPSRIVTARGQSRLAATAVRETPPILAALERYFGRPYPFAKLDLIAVPEFAYGAMENPGLITFADGILLREAPQLGPAELNTMVLVVAHEIAHMWFGDLVTMAWWDDLWLNEAFADWMADRIQVELHPELESALAEVGTVNHALSGDALASQPAIRPAQEATPEAAMGNVGSIYAKGSAVLAMTERWIGEAAFRQGVLDYLQAHAWKNATGPDLWNALGKAAGKDVAGMLTTFITQPGAPLVEVQPVGDPAARRVRFTQRRFARAGETLPAQIWRVPLGVRYRDAAGVREWSGELVGATLEVSLPGEGAIQWLLPNAASVGYYRWGLGAKELEALVTAAKELTAAERIGLVGNLRALLEADALDGDRYLALLAGLLSDESPAVLSAVVEAFDRASRDLVPPQAEAEFAAFVRRNAGPLARRLGLRPVAGEKESLAMLRPAVMALVGEIGDDRELRAEARRMAASALADPAAVDESVAETIFDLAAHDGDRAQWEEYRRHFESAASPGARLRYLFALGGFTDASLLRATLDYGLSDKVRPTELPHLLLVVVSAGRQDLLFPWLVERWSEVSKRVPPFVLTAMPLAAGGCSAELWQRAETFFADPAHRAPGIELELARTGQRVAACVRLREREGPAVERWLRAS